MDHSFAPLRRTLAALACAILAGGTAFAQSQLPANEDNGSLPAGGKFKECNGYVRHVSSTNMKIHCIDGKASDQSFLYLPRFATSKSGRSVQTSELRPDTPVRVLYTQTLGVKKAYRIFIADSDGNEKSSFRS